MMKKVAYLLFFASSLSFSQVGIGTTTPDASAALEIESINAGILVPRMTQAQRTAIASPATGLLVYQNDATTGFWFYNGSVWGALAGGGSGEFQSLGGIVQNTTNLGSDDFVFGSATLSGTDSRFFFDKSKSAFRAGEAFGTEWDDVNVGSGSIGLGNGTASGINSVALQGGLASQSNSVAIGPNTQANAEGSFAIGDNSTVDSGADYGIAFGFESNVTDQYGIAIGYQNIASGERSFAFGSGATASGTDATAFNNGVASAGGSFAGIYATASGLNSIALQGGLASQSNSVAIGPNTQANAEGSFAMGDSTIASADNAIAFGFNASATDDYAVAMGSSSISSGSNAFSGSGGNASGTSATALTNGIASGDDSFAVGAATASGNNSVAMQGGNASGVLSFALGDNNTASGESSVALGAENTAYSYAEFVVGYESSAYTPTSTTTAVSTDRLFVVGNSTSENAITVLKDGKTGISRIPTTNMLEVSGNASKTTAGSWLANSDRRLKKNIQTISEEEALQKLMQLRGVTYQWNDNKTGNKRPEGSQYGFIAQELMEVFPEKVSMDNQGYYQTAYGDYDAVFVQAVKRLNTKIETLEIENNNLKKELQKIYNLLYKVNRKNQTEATLKK